MDSNSSGISAGVRRRSCESLVSGDMSGNKDFQVLERSMKRTPGSRISRRAVPRRCKEGEFYQPTWKYRSHPLRGGTTDGVLHACQGIFQSTHPLRGGTAYEYCEASWIVFQSTHPLRGGTPGLKVRWMSSRHFNPPTPCGVGRMHERKLHWTKGFQSTHPLRGGTWSMLINASRMSHFNPPTPCGVGPG